MTVYYIGAAFSDWDVVTLPMPKVKPWGQRSGHNIPHQKDCTSCLLPQSKVSVYPQFFLFALCTSHLINCLFSLCQCNVPGFADHYMSVDLTPTLFVINPDPNLHKMNIHYPHGNPPPLTAFSRATWRIKSFRPTPHLRPSVTPRPSVTTTPPAS